MRLFLYGTLIGESATPMARWLAPRLSASERASVPGRLYAVPSRGGWFPALVAGRGGERAQGVVCTATLGSGELARLDHYEGREYRRTPAFARTDAGDLGAVQLYRWRAPLPPGAEPIHGGDFLAWLARTGRKPYAEPGRHR